MYFATNVFVILVFIEFMFTGEVYVENGVLVFIVVSILSFILVLLMNRVMMNFCEVCVVI